jgi:hypothetical protein
MVNWNYECKRCPGPEGTGFRSRNTLCRKKIKLTRGKRRFNLPCGKPRKQRNDVNVSRKNYNNGKPRESKPRGTYHKNVKTWLKPYWWNQLEGWAVNVFTFLLGEPASNEESFNQKYAKTETAEERFELAKAAFKDIIQGDKAKAHMKVALQALKMFFNLQKRLSSTKQKGNIRTYTASEMKDALDDTVPRIGARDTPATDAEFDRFLKPLGVDAAKYEASLKNAMDYPTENMLANYDTMLKTLFNAANKTEKDQYLRKKALFNFFKDLFQYTTANSIDHASSNKYFQAFLYYQYDLDGMPPLLSGSPADNGGSEKKKEVDKKPQTEMAVFMNDNYKSTNLNFRDFIYKEEQNIPLDQDLKYKVIHRYLRYLFHSKSFPKAKGYNYEYVDKMQGNKDRTGDRVSRTKYDAHTRKELKEARLRRTAEFVQAHGSDPTEHVVLLPEKETDEKFARKKRKKTRAKKSAEKRIEDLERALTEADPAQPKKIAQMTRNLNALRAEHDVVEDNQIEKEDILEKAEANANVMKTASAKLKDDKSFVMQVVVLNGETLQYVSERLRNNKEVVLAAVSQNPEAYQYASEILQQDKDVKQAAFNEIDFDNLGDNPDDLFFDPNAEYNHEPFDPEGKSPRKSPGKSPSKSPRKSPDINFNEIFKGDRDDEPIDASLSDSPEPDIDFDFGDVSEEAKPELPVKPKTKKKEVPVPLRRSARNKGTAPRRSTRNKNNK